MEVTIITATYYEVTVKVKRTGEDGMSKIVKETIVVKALSFTEAEKKAAEFYDGESLEKVCAIKEAPYGEYVRYDNAISDVGFCKVVVSMTTINETTEKEKTAKVAYLVNADATQKAQDIITAMFKDTVVDYKVVSVKETTVADIVLD